MSDVVLKMALVAEEVPLFGRYLTGFIESRSEDAERMGAAADAPFVMVSQDPSAGDEHRVVIFQEPSLATAFSAGWAALRNGLKPATAA